MTAASGTVAWWCCKTCDHRQKRIFSSEEDILISRQIIVFQHIIRATTTVLIINDCVNSFWTITSLDMKKWAILHTLGRRRFDKILNIEVLLNIKKQLFVKGNIYNLFDPLFSSVEGHIWIWSIPGFVCTFLTKWLKKKVLQILLVKYQKIVIE